MRRKEWTADDYRAKSKEYAQRPIVGYKPPRRPEDRLNEDREPEVDEHSLGERLAEGVSIMHGGEDE